MPIARLILILVGRSLNLSAESTMVVAAAERAAPLDDPPSPIVGADLPLSVVAVNQRRFPWNRSTPKPRLIAGRVGPTRLRQ